MNIKAFGALCLLISMSTTLWGGTEFIVNGSLQQEKVESFTYDGNRLIVVTRNKSPSPTPTNPPVANDGVCQSSGSIQCSIKLDWGGTSQLLGPDSGAARSTRVTVPAGSSRAIVYPFTTTSNPNHTFQLVGQTPAGYVHEARLMWISTTPGGEIISGCASSAGIQGMILVSHKSGKTGCILNPNTNYFLNFKHEYKDSPSSFFDMKKMAQVF